MLARSLVRTCFAASLLVPFAVAAQDRTEREVVELIVRDGPQARAIRAMTEVTHREQLARLAYPNPGLTYSREGAGFTEFLQFEQSLPIFGTRDALSRAGAAATAAAEAEREAMLWMLRADASEAVARLLADQARLDVIEAHAREVERLIEILRTREREGEGSRFDRLRAEQELRDARQLVTSVAVGIGEAKAGLSAMLPRDVTVNAIIPVAISEQLPPPLERLIERARSSRGELRALQQSAERAAQESSAARRARLPSPTLFGGLKRADTESGRERGGVFGVSLSLPLFDAGGKDAARWAAEGARVDAERAFVEHQIQSEIARASEALALRQKAILQEQDSGADELTAIAVVAYREGEVGILELLDAARTASRAKNRSIDLRLDARMAQVALERAVGEVLWP